MAKLHRIYVVLHEGAFRYVALSYSEAVRESHGPFEKCCEIKSFEREDY
jgi:hypothetical protein